MLLFLLVVAKSVIVSIDGYVPSRFKNLIIANSKERNLEKVNENIIHIAESPFRFKYMGKKKLLCSFKEKTPEFRVYKKTSDNKRLKESPTVSIPQNMPGSFSLISNIQQHNISVSFFINYNCSFLILPENDLESLPKGYKEISLAHSPLAFLASSNSEFFVFSDAKYQITQYLCNPGYFIQNVMKILFLIFTLFVLITGTFLLQKKLSLKSKITFWVLDYDLNVYYGPNLSILNDASKEILIQETQQCKMTNTAINSAIRLKRQVKSMIYDRMLVIPLNSKRLIAVLWEEYVDPNNPLEFKLTLESGNNEISSPIFSFSSYREYRPVKISFSTKNNVNCVIESSSAILAPFQPYGHLFGFSLTVLDFMLKSQRKSGNFEDLFSMYTTKISKFLKTQRTFVFNENGNIIFQYCLKTLKPFDQAKIMELYQKSLKAKKNLLFKNFFGDDLSYFIASICNLIFIYAFKEPCDIFERACSSFSTLSILYFMNFLTSNINTTIINRFYESLDMINKRFILIQSGLQSRNLIICKNSIASGLKSIEEYKKFMVQNGLERIDLISNEALDLMKKGGGKCMKKSTKLNVEGKVKYYVLSGIVDYDHFFQEYIYTCFVEDVTEKKAYEEKLLSYKEQIQKAIQAFHIHELIINNGKIKLVDDGLFKELGRPSDENLLLISLVYPDDIQNCYSITKGKFITLRLLNSDNVPIYYIALTSGKHGMIFCLDNLDDIPKITKNPEEEGMHLSSQNQVIVWTVDTQRDIVHQLFMQPTIWEALSVDQDTKFSSIIDYIHNDDHENFLDGYTKLLNGEIDQWDCDVRLIRMNSNYEWYKFVFVLTQSRFLNCLTYNIQKEKEMVSKLEDTQRLRDLLMSSGKLALWQFVDDHEPIEILDSFDPGISILIKMNWTFIENQVHPDFRDAFKNAVLDTLENDKSFEIDIPLLFNNAQGVQYWVSLRGKKNISNSSFSSLFQNNNNLPNNEKNIREIVGVCIDVTDFWNAYTVLEEEKKAAELANQQKTIFLSNVSHEIRTPMNGIFGMLDVLVLQDLSSEQRVLAESLLSSSAQLMSLLDDTLHIAKIESGSLTVNPTIFSITKIIEPISIASGSSARLKQLKFYVIIDKKFPSLLYGDPQLIIQIVNNFVSNALKFTKQGSITVSFKWEEDNQDDEIHEKCILSVKDTGIGIDPKRQQIIFERFQQADASVQRFYGGTGLGLALVKDICTELGGNVKINSSLGNGSEFICEIPMNSVMFSYSPPFKDGIKHTIMISCTDQVVSSSIIDWMIFHKYDVLSFENPEEIIAISKEEKRKIDAIFVEGNRDIWHQLKDIVSNIFSDPQQFKPLICSICEAGEKILFDYTISKPLLMEHFLHFMNLIRYNKLKFKDKSYLDKKYQLTNSLAEHKRRKKILVVEDNKANQFVMSKILQNIGCDFVIAENGQKAIDVLKVHTFDLVFMDCQMPVLDGLEATKIIRSSNEPYSTIPIIALTANAVEGDEKTCLDAGMNDYLAKPVRIEQISSKIKQYALR